VAPARVPDESDSGPVHDSRALRRLARARGKPLRRLALAWWHANATQFAVPHAADFGYWGQTLAWALWPAWPLALWTLWEGRRRTIEPGTRVLIAAVTVAFALLLFLSDPREVYALPSFCRLRFLPAPACRVCGAAPPTRSHGSAP